MAILKYWDGEKWAPILPEADWKNPLISEAEDKNGSFYVGKEPIKVYEHPIYSEETTGLYKIAIEDQHVSNIENVTQEDITKLGIPGINVLEKKDLNNITDFGFYLSPIGGNTNTPEGVNNFGLVVVKTSNGSCTQILQTNTATYRRKFFNNEWSEWTEDKYTDTWIANDADNAGYVAKPSGKNVVWVTNNNNEPSWRNIVYYGECNVSTNNLVKNVIVDGLSDDDLFDGMSLYVKMNYSNKNENAQISLNDEQETYKDIVNPYWEDNSIVHFVFDGSVWHTIGYNNNVELDSSIEASDSMSGVEVSMNIEQTDGLLSDASVSLTGIGTAASKDILPKEIGIASADSTNESNLVSTTQVSNYVKEYVAGVLNINDDLKEAVRQIVDSQLGEAVNDSTELVQKLKRSVLQIQSGISNPNNAIPSNECMMYIQYEELKTEPELPEDEQTPDPEPSEGEQVTEPESPEDDNENELDLLEDETETNS